jgi:predicted DNA-binding transcriptional regulator AlpA
MSDYVETVDLDEACRLIGRSRKWWYRHRDGLVAKHGFPLPMPGPGTLLWRRDEIIAWRDRLPMPTRTMTERADSVAQQVLARAGLAASS